MKKAFMVTVLGIMIGVMSLANAGQGEKMEHMSGKEPMKSSGGGMMMKGEQGSGDMMPMMQHMHGMMGKMTGMMDKMMHANMDHKQMMEMSGMMDEMSEHMKHMSEMTEKGDYSEKPMEELKKDMMETEKKMDHMAM